MIVDRPRETELLPLVKCLLSQLEPAEQQRQLAKIEGFQFQAVIEDRDDLLSGLWVCRRERNQLPIAAMWSHRLPGASVTVGQPFEVTGTEKRGNVSFQLVSHPSAAALADLLLGATCDWIQNRPGISPRIMAQVVLESAEAQPMQGGMEFWKTHQFFPLVDLTYVLKTFPNDNSAESKSYDLYFEPVTLETDPDRWCRVLESTFKDSLDCPALNGKRATIDALQGYRWTGTFLDDGWWIVTSARPNSDIHQSTDDGCVILADHPESDLIELVYFGVAANSRGNGIGTQIFHEIFKFVAEKNRAHLLAAVDSQNLPALKLYRKFGFRVITERTVLARFF